ncbi:ferrochelatase [Nitrococcus mobilis]|uniref:Ferrochelatase n=1 Tax=Nitrococcus mobilis Nb-231 TaxID=314278 RepID=A4BNN9_9GAMM|nr:ferrochelatase [Nitrococcus mobilis]EAR22838.1 ferrochelatase [Nitrococcus mobilis Nb-231]
MTDPHRATGVLLTNLGTPAAPTPQALRRYLAEFLWDHRVVELPRPLWWLVLNGVILWIRPRRSAAAYQRIWTQQGSPLLTISQQQAARLAERLNEQHSSQFKVALGMRYGQPSIESAYAELETAGCERILVLPLYPQYSAATTASTYDALGAVLRKRRVMPHLRLLRDYHDHPDYISALAASIREYWQQHGRGERLLISFHGIPKRYAERGDPYPIQCERTAQALAKHLDLASEEWQLVFQSRFGPQPWLEPYTDRTLEHLARNGVKRVDLVCPGFAADCLETLEENDMLNHERFLAAGGNEFHYIPCLNDRPDHIDALGEIIKENLAGWL